MALRFLQRLLGTRKSSTTSSTPRRQRPRLEELENRITPVTTVTDLTQGLTPTSLVQQLLGPGVQVSNVQFTGNSLSAGTFSGGQNTVGFATGIILSSGEGRDVIGTGGYTGTYASTDLFGPRDTDLDALVAPQRTYDATVLEFDFVPQGSLLTFQYVFSSEEYPDFVGSAYNDVFAFFLNGSNVALIPGTNTPVSINNVNNGNPSAFPTPWPPTNPQYFVDNYTTAARAIALGGLTTVLSVSANVIPGQSNHIKLAIADTADGILDSDVFIKAGSFSAAKAPKMKVQNPMRFIYHKSSKLYTGTMSLVNVGTAVQKGPVWVVFQALPPGVTIQNATGTTSDGKYYIKISVNQIGVNKSVKLHLQLKNPQKKTLPTYFQTAKLQFTAIDPANLN